MSRPITRRRRDESRVMSDGASYARPAPGLDRLCDILHVLHAFSNPSVTVLPRCEVLCSDVPKRHRPIPP